VPLNPRSLLHHRVVLALDLMSMPELDVALQVVGSFELETGGIEV